MLNCYDKIYDADLSLLGEYRTYTSPYSSGTKSIFKGGVSGFDKEELQTAVTPLIEEAYSKMGVDTIRGSVFVVGKTTTAEPSYRDIYYVEDSDQWGNFTRASNGLTFGSSDNWKPAYIFDGSIQYAGIIVFKVYKAN